MEFIFLVVFGLAIYFHVKAGNLPTLGKMIPKIKPEGAAASAPMNNAGANPAEAAKPAQAATEIDYDIPTYKRRGVVIDFSKKKGKKRAAKRTKDAPVRLAEQAVAVGLPPEMQEPQFEVIA